ncbi:hypothetical protein [Sodalis sp.]|uniref:hypothetical protein n=1 Tax=Sodalis sp. (in: enterobacteria) TaxID=1898979 RepID=UPI0038737D8D
MVDTRLFSPHTMGLHREMAAKRASGFAPCATSAASRAMRASTIDGSTRLYGRYIVGDLIA